MDQLQEQPEGGLRRADGQKDGTHALSRDEHLSTGLAPDTVAMVTVVALVVAVLALIYLWGSDVAIMSS